MQVEVRLYNDVKRVELGYDFIRNPETDPSAIYVAMPWLLENAKLTFDVPGGVVRSGEDRSPARALVEHRTEFRRGTQRRRRFS